MESQPQEKQPDSLEIEKVLEFDWLSYLDQCQFEASPESAFSHVEAALDTGVKEGMIVERPLDDSGEFLFIFLPEFGSILGQFSTIF